jgi:hypothetical protein
VTAVRFAARFARAASRGWRLHVLAILQLLQPSSVGLLGELSSSIVLLKNLYGYRFTEVFGRDVGECKVIRVISVIEIVKVTKMI